MSFLKKSLKTFLALILVAIVVWKIAEPYSDKALIKQILNLEQLPESLKEQSCKIDGINDMLVSCYFELDATSAQDLLRGYNYSDSNKYSRSYLKVGIMFDVQSAYSYVEGASFIDILMNESKTQVRVDRLYE